MRDGLKKAGLIGLGTVLGLVLRLDLSVFAQREARLPIPYEDLQLLSAVFGKIKSDYVEPVSDDKLIKEAINGMVHGLDPHSDFLDAEAFKELQVSTQGKFGGLGIEVGVEDGIVRVISPIEDTPAFRAGIKAGDLGGLLNQAVAVSAAFLPKDSLVVYTDGRTPDARMRLTANKDNYVRRGDDFFRDVPAAIKKVPMVVLVDGGTASASEIVAGALQDHKRATVMGAQTFGKGSVQTILPLGNNAGLKLTTARYYTPSGRSIQAKGIEPDIAIDDGRDTPNRLREANLEHHLTIPVGGAKGDAALDTKVVVPVPTPAIKGDEKPKTPTTKNI